MVCQAAQNYSPKDNEVRDYEGCSLLSRLIHVYTYYITFTFLS